MHRTALFSRDRRFRYRLGDPAELRRAGYPVGRYNDWHIAAAVRECQNMRGYGCSSGYDKHADYARGNIQVSSSASLIGMACLARF